MTCELSVVELTVSPVLLNISSKSMVKFVTHSVSPPMIVYVPVRSIPEPAMFALLLAMLENTHVRSSLPVNESMMVSPNLAYHELLFEDVMFTKINVGFVQNDVKCNVSKLHSCAIPVNALPVHEKLLNTDALEINVPSVSLTTMSLILFIPFGYCAVVRYIVNVAGRLLNALHEAVELS